MTTPSPPDGEHVDEVIRRTLVGAPVDEAVMDDALAHIETCERCQERFEHAHTAACDAVVDDLLEAAADADDIGELDTRYPALGRHLADCRRCRVLLTDLTAAEGAPAPDVEINVAKLFEGALARALVSPEPIARQRAAERLGVTAELSEPLRATLTRMAAGDPDAGVRTAAASALGAPVARATEPEPGTEPV